MSSPGLNSREGSDDPMRGSIDVPFARLWADVRAMPWLVVGVILGFFAAGCAYAIYATPWYRAEVLLAPEKDDSRSRLVGQFGGLASLAGLDLGRGEDAEPLAVLRSRGFAREFIADEGLAQVLLHDQWDATQKVWKGPREKWPDERDAVKVFIEDVRQVVEDKKTGLVTVAVVWTDPVVAARWASMLVERLNARMRMRAIEESEKNVKFLRAEILANDLVPLQQATARLLEIELQKLMLARAKEQFAFKVVDAAQVPKKAVRPQKPIVLGLSLLGGMIVSLVIVVVRRWLVGISAGR